MRPEHAAHLLIVFVFLISCSYTFAISESVVIPSQSLTIIARPGQKGTPTEAKSYFGHAYVIVSIPTKSGIKEDIYGFYPTTGGTGIIKGPGALKSEFRCGKADDCGPEGLKQLRTNFSDKSSSVVIPISDADRIKVYSIISKWNSDNFQKGDSQVVPKTVLEYRAFDQNCIDFVADVAKSLGYPVPERSVLQTPIEFLNQLRPLTKVELARRVEILRADLSDQKAKEAMAKAKQAQEKAKKSEEAANEAEKNKLLAQEQARKANEEKIRAENALADVKREASRQKIPAGWIKCTCAEKHKRYGIMVGGVLYHGPEIWCP